MRARLPARRGAEQDVPYAAQHGGARAGLARLLAARRRHAAAPPPGAAARLAAARHAHRGTARRLIPVATIFTI